MNSFFSKNKPTYASKKLSVKTKGLTNEPGENNCFLNSAVQVLWHLDVFRTNFSRFQGHNCVGEKSCIFCAMTKLFQRFKYSDRQILPPTELRESLAIMYQAQRRFQLGLMDDAAECFENLLIQIHKHLVDHGPSETDDICSEKHCLPHQKFGMMLIEQGVCVCGETSEPLPFTQLVHYVSANALSDRLKETLRSNRSGVSGITFGKLIRSVGILGGQRRCPSNCGSQIETKTTLMNAPDVISIGVNWDSEEPDIRQIIDLVETIHVSIKLQDMFDTVLDKHAQRNDYHLSSMVCYYGKHYSAFSYNRKRNRWYSIDDATVTEVGKTWKDIINKCIKGHYQPLLLLYTNYNAVPLSLGSAPPIILRGNCSSQSSPALSHRDSEVASSSSSDSASPAHSANGNTGTPHSIPSPAHSTNGNTGTRRKKLLWTTSAPTTNVGQYREPKGGASFTVYSPYPHTGKEKSNSLKPSNDINGNSKGYSY